MHKKVKYYLSDHFNLKFCVTCCVFNFRDCIGILGCEWCRLDSDGITPLPKKFCTEQRRCFGGVLGAQTPYADEIIGK